MKTPFSTPMINIRLMILGLISLLTVSLSSRSAQAQTYAQKTLYSFGGGTDGVGPWSGLVNVNGMLYGTTQYGGTPGKNGTIFSIDPTTHTETTVYCFQGFPYDGANPVADLTNVNGILYGTTQYGGPHGSGTLFAFDPSTNKVTLLYSFSSTSTDGKYPMDAPVYLNGVFYGTTSQGGTSGDGTLYSYNPTSKAENILSSFGTTSTDGKYPYAGLTALSGILYGATENGGSLNDGTLFSFDPSTSTRSLLHTFTYTQYVPDGSEPNGSLIAVGGVLYGTTDIGGTEDVGTVFAINPDATGYHILHQFTETAGDGAIPRGSLITINGILYGTTEEGGTTGYGTVFSLDPSTNTESILYEVQGGTTDGEYSFASLLDFNGTLYGTTNQGGADGDGTIFSLTSATVPTANTDGCTIAHNKARTNAAPGVLANDLDGGEGPLTAVLVSNVSHGTLVLNSDGSFTYTPNTGYAGKDVFTYQAVNPVGHSNTTTCTFTVLAGTPTANTDGATIKLNTARTFAAPGVLSNDLDGGEGPLTAVLVSNVSHGHLTLGSNGSFTYTPNTGYVGKDVFTYQAVNPVGKSNTTTCTLTVVTTPTAYNDGATIAHNTARTFAAPGVLANDNNGGASPMTATLVANVSHGTLTLHSDGSFVYTPKTGYSGTDTFTYRAVTAIGQSNIATVTLTVQ